MNGWRNRVLLVVAVLALAPGLPGAVAGAVPHPTAAVAAPTANRGLVPAQAPTSQFFQGDTAGEYPFSLQPGTYEVQAVASYSPLNDPSNTGQCSFDAHINDPGMPAPIELSGGAPVPVTSFGNFNYSLINDFSAAQNTLVVMPFTTCDWTVTILPYKSTTATPGITIQTTGVFLMRSGKLTPTAVVPFSQDVYFVVSYTVTGTLPSTLHGTITIKYVARPAQTFTLSGVKGVPKAYWEGVFSPKTKPGPTVATFTLTAGSLRASRALHFTLGNGLSAPSG